MKRNQLHSALRRLWSTDERREARVARVLASFWVPTDPVAAPRVIELSRARHRRAR